MSENKLLVKLLSPKALPPTIAHSGEDLGYDLYSLEDITIKANVVNIVRTGVALSCTVEGLPAGLLVRDRSSMAKLGLAVAAGVIDAGYRGEVVVLINYISPDGENPRPPESRDFKSATRPVERMRGEYKIKAGDKIAQVLPYPIHTGVVEVVTELPESVRGEAGFGSSGQ